MKTAPNTPAPLVINGRIYPLWQKFVNQAPQFIGGIMQDFGDSMDRALGISDGASTTKITGIRLEPNGPDSAYFTVDGEDFSCGFDTTIGGIVGVDEDWITFSGYGGHKWRIKTPRK
jgi:hypothetical protein